MEQRVIKSSIALQHIDNIWDRKAKGLQNNKPKQLANYYAEPIEIDINHYISNFSNVYKSCKDNLIKIVKDRYGINKNKDLSLHDLKLLNILIVVSLDMRKQNSASNIRPAKLIQAFKKTAHEIDIIDAPSRRAQRKNIIKLIIKNVFINKKYDLCYYEPSTYPLQRTERLLINWLKKQNTWVSCFHRDMYWRYKIGLYNQPNKKIQKHKLKQEDNLYFLEKNINLLFTPTNLYAKKLKTTLKTIALPPAGNSYNIEYNADKRDGVIYVGGVSELYGIDLLIDSFILIQQNKHLPLIIVCRTDELIIIQNKFPNYKQFGWLTIIHCKENELHQYYKIVRLGIIPKKKIAYNELSLSFKIMEYASFGLPIAASDNYEQTKLIEENKLGINIGSTVESFSIKIVEFYNDTKSLNEFHQNSIKFIEHKGLWEHRVSTIIKQFREQNGG